MHSALEPGGTGTLVQYEARCLRNQPIPSYSTSLAGRKVPLQLRAGEKTLGRQSAQLNEWTQSSKR